MRNVPKIRLRGLLILGCHFSTKNQPEVSKKVVSISRAFYTVCLSCSLLCSKTLPAHFSVNTLPECLMRFFKRKISNTDKSRRAQDI